MISVGKYHYKKKEIICADRSVSKRKSRHIIPLLSSASLTKQDVRHGRKTSAWRDNHDDMCIISLFSWLLENKIAEVNTFRELARTVIQFHRVLGDGVRFFCANHARFILQPQWLCLQQRCQGPDAVLIVRTTVLWKQDGLPGEKMQFM